MSNRSAYYALVEELKAIEETTGLYLTDENVDAENIDRGLVYESEEYYANMLICAKSAAGYRAEEAGRNINALIGRVIY